MKKILTVLTMVMMVFVASTDHAEAKRFGGGKKFGTTQKTAPAQPKQQADTNKSTTQQGTKAGSSKKGLMGGLLGGLLMGGLLASLFAGGAFEGIQFMDILIIAGVAFILFKIFKSMRTARAVQGHQGQAAYAGNVPTQQPQQTRDNVQPIGGQSTAGAAAGGFASTGDVPFNLPQGFDVNGFLSGSRDHYRTVQQAWNTNDLEKIREYLSPELFAEMSEERAKLEGEQHTEVMFVDAELVRADQNFGTAELSIKFTGRYRDTVEDVEQDITDIWHLTRDINQADAPWLITGVEGS